MKKNLSSNNITLSVLRKMKGKQKIVCLTSYDATFSRIMDDAGIDIILVGDSLGMVIKGKDDTVCVTMNDVVYHTACVVEGSNRSLIIADMPFMSYNDAESAVNNAKQLMQEGGAHMIKLEANERQIEIIREMNFCSIPVCAHLGVRPQSVHKQGGYTLQGKDSESMSRLVENALAVEEAGADILLLECVADDLAKEITNTISIPVIGIGSGKYCDGQIQVLYDLIGISDPMPKFAQSFMQANKSIQDAIIAYIEAVRAEQFPA